MSKPTKAESEHMARVAALGCCICGDPAEVHHVRTKANRKRDNMRVIPLCPEHHRTGGKGVAVHAGKKSWKTAFGLADEDVLHLVSTILERKYK